jgi:hypothetical protein
VAGGVSATGPCGGEGSGVGNEVAGEDGEGDI